MSSDLERQQNEFLVLKSIYDSTQFSCNVSRLDCAFYINCELPKSTLSIKYSDSDPQMSVRWLPRINFYLKLPPDYPSKSPPDYSLVINWLPPWQTALVCQRLDELWLENSFGEVLFDWSNFLKNDLMSFLGVEETLDLTFLYSLYVNPKDEYLKSLLKWSDSRVIYIYVAFGLNPVEKLREHDETGALMEFNTTSHDCEICFVAYLGNFCRELDNCGHIFCQSCIEEYLRVKINERNVKDIRCPAYNCNNILKSIQIKDLCAEDLFDKYQKYLQEIRLFNTKNLVYCPRKFCRAAVIVKQGESLASCFNCEYHFCAYCFRVYHGVAACNMNSQEKKKLIEEYNKGNKATKNYLEAKYGRRQIKEYIEKQLTDDYLKENTKVCPTCKVIATKTSGCNLMSCSKCHTNFCWICSNKIMSEDPYDHFKSVKKGSCVGLLFEGVDAEAEFQDFVQQNIEDVDLIMIDQILENDN